MPGDDMAEFCGRFETNPQWSRPICINCGRHFTDHPAELLRAPPPKPRLYTRAEVEAVAEAVRARFIEACDMAAKAPTTQDGRLLGELARALPLAPIIVRVTGAERG